MDTLLMTSRAVPAATKRRFVTAIAPRMRLPHVRLVPTHTFRRWKNSHRAKAFTIIPKGVITATVQIICKFHPCRKIPPTECMIQRLWTTPLQPVYSYCTDCDYQHNTCPRSHDDIDSIEYNWKNLFHSSQPSHISVHPNNDWLFQSLTNQVQQQLWMQYLLQFVYFREKTARLSRSHFRIYLTADFTLSIIKSHLDFCGSFDSMYPTNIKAN